MTSPIPRPAAELPPSSSTADSPRAAEGGREADEAPAAGAVSTARMIAAAGELVAALETQVIGQRGAIDILVAAYLAGGHALLHGLPGLGKTRLARAFAASLGVGFRRVQFTPDLMPADLVGTNVFDGASASFRLLRGPAFTEVLMADEINRTPPKTQSALLEGMQERQVTIDGESHPRQRILRRRDAESHRAGRRLPAARGAARSLPGARRHGAAAARSRARPAAPERSPEPSTTPAGAGASRWGRAARPCWRPERLWRCAEPSRRVPAAPELLEYLIRLATAARRSPQVDLGVSPRAVLGLLEVARGAALLEGRDFLLPDDLKRMLAPCWAHRHDPHPRGRSSKATRRARSWSRSWRRSRCRTEPRMLAARGFQLLALISLLLIGALLAPSLAPAAAVLDLAGPGRRRARLADRAAAAACRLAEAAAPPGAGRAVHRRGGDRRPSGARRPRRSWRTWRTRRSAVGGVAAACCCERAFIPACRRRRRCAALWR